MYNAINTDSPVEKEPKVESSLERRLADFFQRRRQISLWGPVDDESARSIIERLLFLDDQAPEIPITLLINSPGGSTTSGLAVVDAMNLVRAPVRTICLGMAASFGAVLLACGAPGRRLASPLCRVMIHQPWVAGRIEGRPEEIVRHAREIQNTRERLNRVLAERTGKPLETIESDTDRDFWMSPEEAREYGLIDEILKSEDVYQ